MSESVAESTEYNLPFTTGDLRDLVLGDGTRLFAELWETCSVAELKKHATKLNGLTICQTQVPTSDSCSLLSFQYLDHLFFVTAAQSEYMFFVTNNKTPDSILMTVATHFNQLFRRTSRGNPRLTAFNAEIASSDPDTAS